MKNFPMFLRVADRRVTIVGGGEQAAQKARLMLKTEAEIRVIAPALDPELEEIRAEGRLSHQSGAPVAADFTPGALTFIATGCFGADAAAADLAVGRGAVTNVVDQPWLCEAVTPSIVDRDPVVVAIGTEGTAPVLGRQIKTRIETLLEPRLGAFAALAGRLRPAVAASVPKDDRRAFWRWAFAEAPRQLFARGNEREAAQALKAAIAAHGAPDAKDGAGVAVIRAASEADLATLRAVRRLQEADLVIRDADAPAAMLELARRDAERAVVATGDLAEVGIRAAESGRVVYLTAADVGDVPSHWELIPSP